MIFLMFMAMNVYANSSYYSLEEDYDGQNPSVFVSTYTEIVQGDGENTSAFIMPKPNSSGNYQLGFRTLDKEINGIAVMDFRAKVIDGKTYFAIDTRQNSNYLKNLYMSFVERSVISKWSYYRILIDFDKNTMVYEVVFNKKFKKIIKFHNILH